ncbi:integrating conjugative element protein [Hyphococcus luteus]|uniref:Integrating conjugative element protein n=1 Tax=Hyphococcus luteus TaxID=2058213 RepID=A0A2S7K009_9PROT|nr:integrating conjugative element protein [Marinicaulis flavus]PQA85855.1 integrating conjugative element protein [Marinicaulis flavus]
MTRQALLCLLIFVCAPAAAEDPRVLYSTGETTPIADLFADPALREKLHASAQQPVTHPNLSSDSLYPIRSKRLTVGRVGDRSLAVLAEIKKRPGMRPVFLIGDDPTSAAWLKGNADYLKSSGAVGLVVNVESRARFEALARVAPDLPLFAGGGDDIARELGLFHYPVLITPNSVQQ